VVIEWIWLYVRREPTGERMVVGGAGMSAMEGIATVKHPPGNVGSAFPVMAGSGGGGWSGVRGRFAPRHGRQQR